MSERIKKRRSCHDCVNYYYCNQRDWLDRMPERQCWRPKDVVLITQECEHEENSIKL
jgi:hypothetical protein